MADTSSLEQILRGVLGVTDLAKRVETVEERTLRQDTTITEQTERLTDLNARLTEQSDRLAALAENPLTDVPWVVGAGDSIREAYDSGEDSLLVLPSYDGDGETVTLEVPRDRRLRLQGLGTELSHGLRIIASGNGSYGEAPVISGFYITDTEDAEAGLEICAAPYTSVQDVTVHGTEGDGFILTCGPDGDGAYGVQFSNCQAWNLGGKGWHTYEDANPHATGLYHCHAVACKEAGMELRGTQWQVWGGSAQMNYDAGIRVRGGGAGSVMGAYIEGNDRGAMSSEGDRPVEMDVRRHAGLTLMANRFHAINPRTTEHDYHRVERAVNCHGSPDVSAFGNFFLKYGDGAFALFDCPGSDLHASSQTVHGSRLLSGAGMAEVLSYGRPVSREELD